jgi:ferredoxin
MDSQLKAQVVFHLTGRREAAGDAVAGLSPALLAPYRRLDELRYDFPVVLVRSGDGDSVQSLSGVVDGVLRSLAPRGVAGEGTRRRLLRVEREIRRKVAGGAAGTLRQLWEEATNALAGDADAAFVQDAERARAALPVDGEVADCDARLPSRFVGHVWSFVQREKARSASERIERLVIRLGEILRADYLRSAQALEEGELAESFGAAGLGLFDFAAMSRLLKRTGPSGGLSAQRRHRVERALAALKAQRFFAVSFDVEPSPGPLHEFVFDDPEAALEAFRARLPELVDVLRALQVAELEVQGAYVEDVHDAVFSALDGESVTADDLGFFPDYLVCVARRNPGAPTLLAGALSSGVPIKLLVQPDDLLEDSAPGRGGFAFGLPSSQLAASAIGLPDVFVLQSAASNLLKLRSRIERGLRHRGAALFSVYSGSPGGSLPVYLEAAAAMQSRAFPAFSVDPEAGSDLASRISLENNPQPERDWPVESLTYADQDLQSVTEEVAFTFVDFAAGDGRYASHFAAAPRAAWSESMIPMRQWLDAPPRGAGGGVPYVLAVDETGLLTRLVADERIVRTARRCREGWHRLQELGGIRDSRLERALAREREAWEAEHRRAQEAAPPAVHAEASAGVPAGAPAPAAEVSVEAAEPARNPDEPYIETVRCSTCNECTQVNPRMFKYNDDKQAYIADLKAGTYADLVLAAESCQLSIIHPGKPWDPSEPGLAELQERAKPFL